MQVWARVISLKGKGRKKEWETGREGWREADREGGERQGGG